MENGQLFRAILEHTPDTYFLYDLKGNFVYGNKAAEELIGYKREEFVGRNFLKGDLLPKDQFSKVASIFARNIMMEPTGPVDLTLIRKDKKRIVLEVKTYPLKVEGRHLMLGIGRDITKHKQKEDALRKEKNEIQKYLDIAGVIFLVIDTDQKVDLINKKGCEILGYNEKEIIEKNWIETFIPKRNRNKTKEIFQNLMEGHIEPIEYYEGTILTKSGDEKIIVWHNTLLKDSRGKIVGSLSSGLDITDRKLMEEKLRKSEERYRQLYDEAPVGYHELDREGKILRVNQTEAEMLGYTIQEMIGKSVLDFISPNQQKSAEKEINEKIERKRPLKLFERQYVCRDGMKIDVNIEERLIINGKGQVTGIRSVLRDITDRKHAEKQLKRTAKKLKQTTIELKRSNAELEQFAYVASHDLQEPLRMVTSYVQLLERRYKNKLNSDATDFIAYAVNGVNRMQQLINDLLTYSRVETRGKPFRLTDCSAVLDTVLTNLKVTIEESGAVVTRDILPTVNADTGQLVQLFQNLISNALKFCNNNQPKVHVGVEYSNGERTFYVKDNGIGIDPQFNRRIFMIFQRLHSRDEYHGTGIGLAVCKKIVERHGGRIWVESKPGKGSTFYFIISDKGGMPS